MTTQITIKREVEQLKQRLLPRRKQDIWIVWAGTGDDPEDAVMAWRVVSSARTYFRDRTMENVSLGPNVMLTFFEDGCLVVGVLSSLRL